MNSARWNYKWTEINIRLYAFIRYRMEDTLDGFPHPYVEVLAYIHDTGEQSDWLWRAYRHVDDRVTEMDIASSLVLEIQDEVENFILSDLKVLEDLIQHQRDSGRSARFG